ncbi:CHAT domain-containing protein [Leptolyngbya sp. CCNP1308]|uniref:CHAT domain-containing protein n=1 Tax=Leptolyngbya sp. CCNP1308 TaxID=3110255 RepID=UPI002B1F4A12|nr:CHAT domain-containing protein [Leptolyngbya sp. CCNP1308]MEA5452819.1 CHAT domain-containing protein [Leptolyngbya sp. CCNP1308]
MGRSKALRQVHLDMIRSEIEYSHPYCWAAFVLAGDWHALNTSALNFSTLSFKLCSLT